MSVREIPVHPAYGLEEFRAHVELDSRVARLESVARACAGEIDGRRIFMVNSSAAGGGVAEMLPGLLGLLEELGFDARWLVIEPRDPRFFAITKRVHNLLHDAGDEAPITAEDTEWYRTVSERLARDLERVLEHDDLLVVHDPQPAGCGALAAERAGLRAIWRCHIGVDCTSERTEAAWGFLGPWLERYHGCVFSVRDYVPDALTAKSVIIPPAIDPLSHKNRPLSVPKLTGILAAAGLLPGGEPTLGDPFDAPVRRVQADGRLGSALAPDEIGLLRRPIVAQVARWDGLKGWDTLLEGFARLKAAPPAAARPRRCIEAARLVLAGPDAAGVADDPEAAGTFAALVKQWRALPAAIRRDVVLLSLPMDDLKANALVVNALQRCATLVVQNSRREGFGLTVTEALWKARPVLGSCAAGIRAQIRDGHEGRLVQDPEDPGAIAQVLGEMLAEPKACETYGLNGARRVANEYLLFHQVERWLDLLAEQTRPEPGSGAPP